MYFILPAELSISNLGCWAPHIASFTHVVGYSGLGHFFLSDAATGEFAVLHPFRKAWKGCGAHRSVTAFAAEVLDDPDFVGFVLKPKHQAAIAAFNGPLGRDEVYIPQPYPFLGGTEEPDTYIKGNVWVFAELVGRLHGFEPAI